MTGIRLIQDSEGAVDIAIESGTMAVGETMRQEEYLVLMSHKGEWKEWPTIGVGIADMVGDEDLRYWKREIIDNMARVGIKISKVEYKNGNLKIQP